MKKISPSILGLIISIIIGVLSMWIYFEFLQKKSYQLIDNPTSEALNVTIGNDKYTLAPNQFVEIEIDEGDYELTAEGKDYTLENMPLKITGKRGIINPTKSPYFTLELPYSVARNSDSIFLNHKVVYENKTYQGKITIDSSLYIDNFYYNLNEQFPGLTLKSENESLRSKVFRKDDFKQYYFENFE